jgi:LPXTG-motif cell wall-anchored protein
LCNEMVPEGNDDMVPQEGSLGALALGAAGLLAWRKRRSRFSQGKVVA